MIDDRDHKPDASQAPAASERPQDGADPNRRDDAIAEKNRPGRHGGAGSAGWRPDTKPAGERLHPDDAAPPADDRK